MDAVRFEEAKAAVAALGPLDRLPTATRDRIRGLLLALEVDDVMREVRTRTQAAEAGRRLAAFWADGHIPAGRSAGHFFALIMEAAQADKDAALYERALEAFEKTPARGRNRTALLERMRKTLAELKGR